MNIKEPVAIAFHSLKFQLLVGSKINRALIKIIAHWYLHEEFCYIESLRII